MNLCLCCVTAWLVISIIAQSHFARTASRRNLCKKNLPGVVILYKFGYAVSPTFVRIVDVSAVRKLFASRIEFTSSAVVDLPLVPVIITILILRAGKR